MTVELYRQYDVEQYEDYVNSGEEDSFRTGMWSIAKYNTYAAYMFASRIEKGEIGGCAATYYHKAAERGCDRAFWTIVANPDYNLGVRDLCETYRSAMSYRTELGSSEQDPVMRKEALRLAETFPVLLTVVAFGDLCYGHPDFMAVSKKAVESGSEYAKYLRAGRLLELANWSGDDGEARRMADEAISLLRSSSSRVPESSRLLGEETMTGRWVEADRERAVTLISCSDTTDPQGSDPWRDYLTDVPDPSHDGRSGYSMPGALGRTGRRACTDVTRLCEWAVLMRVTYTGGSGMTSWRSHRGLLGGYENDVFRLIPSSEDRGGAPFFEFKPAGIWIRDPNEPTINADMDTDDIRPMLRICVDSVTEGCRWTGTTWQLSPAGSSTGTSPAGTAPVTAASRCPSAATGWSTVAEGSMPSSWARASPGGSGSSAWMWIPSVS